MASVGVSSFKKYYRTIYATFGYPLVERQGMSSEELAAVEKRLDVQVPAALRAYYLVAGRERRFNTCHHRLLKPQKWSIDKRRLIFMEENQRVLWWGVSIRNPDSDDPSVWQGVNDDEITWVREHRRCSEFLGFILHYQAVNNGFPFCSMADAPDRFDYDFEENGWTYYGEIGAVRAYSRSNQVVCLQPPALPFMDALQVLAGAKTKRDLQAIGDDLGMTLT
ncbi:MAG TPA: hypothetical protein VNK04_20475 [Gemmataceae bacterium]|nr:hypothetical protein [Gemmataceae bacterium]